MDDWTVDSNDALRMCFARAEKDKAVLDEQAVQELEEFHPTFTYPIFGDEEKIYGYRGLEIDFRMASGSLAQYVKVEYDEKLANESTVDNAEETLSNFIPEGYYSDEDQFQSCVEKDAVNFKPYGQRVGSYTWTSDRKGKGPGNGKYWIELNAEQDGSNGGDTVTFEIYHATWDTPGFREYHRRMQIFILLYIEAGSYIVEDEEGWEFLVLYEKRLRHDGIPVYHFAGYSTLFPFFCFPDRVRMRLSQFIITPPYQHKGHGSALYNAIYQYVMSEPRIGELTVEDPAEAFEDLRDRNDLHMLLTHKQFMLEALGTPPSEGDEALFKLVKGKAKLGPPADKAWVEKWRRDLKIAGRQFHRLIEMLALRNLNHADSRAVRAYRLQVKERLYKFNYEILAQLEKQERLDKLEETFQSVREDYQRILNSYGSLWG